MNIKLILIFNCIVLLTYAQPGPTVTSWLQNTSRTGSYYMSGSSTTINNGILVNCQKVEYSKDWVYVTTKGIPAYPTGPFLDGNPSLATDQNAIFKISLNPIKNTGTPIPTSLGNIGIFINGVALFDYRDGVSWNTSTNSLCGGPGNPPCPGGPNSVRAWNRDAILAERKGFDCSKGHPAMGNYHHHQNPSAFKLDIQVVSNICNLYDADGLYLPDSNKHSPLIGFAYDGFPIYGAFGYKNIDGTGGITRMKSGYKLRNITQRTHWADGTDVEDGPPVNTTYPLGYFREDYEYINNISQKQDYLDEHNGRFCITPEYPQGIYCYFATMDEHWNSVYPYLIGPNYYGTRTGQKVNAINETTTIYKPITETNNFSSLGINIYPNPSLDVICIQSTGVLNENINIRLMDSKGSILRTSELLQGSTISWMDVQDIYEGVYFIQIQCGKKIKTEKIAITRPN